MKPTIGIIGGCGPLATVDIEHKILKATQKLLRPLVDQDYFNLLVFNRTQFHDRSDAITSGHTALFDEYLSCAKSLESIGVDVLLIACQTAHVYLRELQNSVKVPIIDIVQEVAQYTSNISSHVFKVGLLSTEVTQKEKLYQKTLNPYGVEVITVPSNIQKKLMEAIYIIKAGINLVDNQMGLINSHYSIEKTKRQTEIENHQYKSVLLKKMLPNPIIIIKEAISYLANKGCKHVILGCTELPLVLPHIDIEEMDVVLIDPNTIVAESAVYIADKLEQEKLQKKL